MLRKVMPYAPYLVVIISLVVAIIMVVTLNGQNAQKAAKKADPEGLPKIAKTAGNTTKEAKPDYKVGTAPKAPSINSADEDKPESKATPARVSSAVARTNTEAATAAATETATKDVETLVNSGPGETLALFVATALSGAIIHSYSARKKLNS